MKPRIPERAVLPVEFHAYKNHVVAVYTLPTGSTIGMRFETPEQMLWFFAQMLEKAALVWPDNEYIREYLSND